MKMTMHTRRQALTLLLFLAAALAGGWAALFAGLPAPDALARRLNPPSIRIEDRYGRLLYEALPGEGGRNTVVALERIPLACRQATVATEDRRFYSHPGVDVWGIGRAVWANLRGGETLSGASTITQQVARNLLMDAGERSQRSLRRKLREGYLAWRLTNRFSKDQVLALYLNQSYYGGMAYGIEAAAQTYFGKPVERLDLAECALLAGLPQAPALYNPFTDLAAARRRQAVVLGLMQTAGSIDASQRALAEREPLVFTETPYPIRAPHFVMQVRAQIDARFTPEQVYQYGGLAVRTTLDLDWQTLAEQAVQRHLDELKKTHGGVSHNVNSAALVALDPASGKVLALVGSPDYFDAAHAGAINMALAPRQPGSALKPLVYAAALDPRSPAPWTAATMLLDVQTSFVTGRGQAYTPANYDLQEHGPVTVRQALASSLNIPAVLTMQHVGLERWVGLGRALGLSTLSEPASYDLSLALGGGEVRLLDLAAAYSALANTGYRVQPQTLLEVRDAHGQVIYTPPAAARLRVLDERVAWLISDILSDPDARRIGFGANSILRLDRPAAVKTGTTSNFHDNWTVGYTPGLVVGVWSGNTDYTPMRDVNGLSGAAPIWHQFMRSVLAGRPVQRFDRPAGLAQVEVCSPTGLLPGPACPYREQEWFIDGTQPRQVEALYREVYLDPATGR
ncbi:MAG: penicillin-binding protein 1C, partial [Chloroflexota bacterium]